jgi:threonine synthase
VSRAVLRCRVCERTQPLAPISTCPACHEPLDVDYGLPEHGFRPGDDAPHSMWRYAALLPHRPDDDATPGLTPLVPAPRLSQALGIELLLKLEDANPTHSFKDRVAGSAVAAAQAFGFETICCASTGNLGEAIAARCAAAGLEAVVLCPRDDVATVPVATYGARMFGVDGSFDDCRALERQLEGLFPWGFVGGNLHALAAEGAKTIAYELAEQLDWQLPDAVVAPVASGALIAKLAQGFDELAAVGALAGAAAPRPRLYGAQAGGCPPLAAAWTDDRPPSRVRPVTGVRSLAVGDPAFGDLAVGAARMSGGAIHAVAEDEIGENMALLAETTGVFGETAAGVTLGALRRAVASGAIGERDTVVLLVTGDGLKTPQPVADRLQPVEVEADADALHEHLGVVI